jgi:hypothetical protein
LLQDGRVGFWWLDPIEELLVLPVAATSRVPAGAHLHACAGLVAHFSEPCALQGMFGPVTAVAWLEALQPPHHHHHYHQPSPTSPHMPHVGRVPDVAVGQTPPGTVATHLAVAVAGCVYVYALILPDLATLQPGSSPAGYWAVQVGCTLNIIACTSWLPPRCMPQRKDHSMITSMQFLYL